MGLGLDLPVSMTTSVNEGIDFLYIIFFSHFEIVHKVTQSNPNGIDE